MGGGPSVLALMDEYIALVTKYGHSAQDAPPGARPMQLRMFYAKAIFSFLVRKLRKKFPARFALGISRLVASRPTVAVARLDSPDTTEPPVKATIETMKMSTSGHLPEACPTAPQQRTATTSLWQPRSPVCVVVATTSLRPGHLPTG